MFLSDRTTMGHDLTKVVQLVGLLVPILCIEIEMLVAVLSCVVHGWMPSALVFTGIDPCRLLPVGRFGMRCGAMAVQ